MTLNIRESTKMSSTLREIQAFFVSSIGQPRFWGIFVSIIVLFALVGPFGTFDRMSLPVRFIYWSTTMLGSWLIAITVIAVVMGSLIRRWDNPFWLMVTGSALAAAPIAIYLNVSIRWFIDPQTLFGFWEQFAYALPMSVIFGVMVYFAIKDVFVSDEESEPAQNVLLERLPHAKRGTVKHLSMQDHYVEVTTTHGKELVLMRMADAVASLADEDGLQVHRSHWINKAFVEASRRENGQPIVVMEDGAEFPVSRSFGKAAREAGVI